MNLEDIVQHSAAAKVLSISVNSYFNTVTAQCVSNLPVEFIYIANFPQGKEKKAKLGPDSIVVAGESQLIELGSPTQALLPDLHVEEADLICRIINHLSIHSLKYLAAEQASETDDTVKIPDSIVTAQELSELMGTEISATSFISLINLYRRYATTVAIELVDYYMYANETYFRINPQYTHLSQQQPWKRAAEPNTTALTPDQAK